MPYSLVELLLLPKNKILMKYTAFSLLLLLLPLTTWAQQSDQSDAVLSGTILDSLGEPLPTASVAIYDSAMAGIITGAPTDAEGHFEIDIEPGQYVVKVTFLS